MTPLIAVVYFYPAFTTTLLLLGFPWGITAPLFMALVARHLRHEVSSEADHAADASR